MYENIRFFQGHLWKDCHLPMCVLSIFQKPIGCECVSLILGSLFHSDLCDCFQANSWLLSLLLPGCAFYSQLEFLLCFFFPSGLFWLYWLIVILCTFSCIVQVLWNTFLMRLSWFVAHFGLYSHFNNVDSFSPWIVPKVWCQLSTSAF